MYNRGKRTWNRKGKKLEHWMVISAGLMVYDALALALSYFLALWIRFDCHYTQIPEYYLHTYFVFIPVYMLVSVAVFHRLRLYRSIWRFASYSELLRVLVATGITFVFHCVGITLIRRMPLSYYLFGIMIQFLLTLGIRFSYRFVLLERKRQANSAKASDAGRVLLVGAGEAGRMILRDIRNNRDSDDVVYAIIDDNPNKWGRYIDGVPVVGGRKSIPEAVEKYGIRKIYVAIPSATRAQKKAILQICSETSCQLMNLPGVYQLYSGEVMVSKMKPVQIEDLLGREPIRQDNTEVFRWITGKVVLVTGVGSIGSELARQIAAHQPKQLILFDIYENNAYDIQLELKKKYPELQLETIIGSVRDSRKIFQVFEVYRPDIVYHAAAHKHVPLMEDSPCEAIKNNVMGTYKTAYAAMAHGCSRFVLISTDKAVNPTNIMGASKRLCEMIIQAFDAKIKAGKAYEIPQLFTHNMDEVVTAPHIIAALRVCHTEFVAVRFGNVLGSNGSVIPLFKKQIEAGGPVTVTHPDIIRYFMTIPEAVTLVLQAGTYARGGEIFVLDMGEPVKIDTLARNLICLSGYKPDVDIQVVYTGLRKGEKLYEERLMAEEGLRKTENEKIHIGCPIPFDTDTFLDQLDGLLEAAYKNKADMVERVKKVVTTYQPAE
ncbi:MAG: nucleoside-diphosphate sugar epimerase/dehydratase [Anaerovoracaceae bacterium]|nr:nucleoside-diphosphate sugar epimerase/dehydratase [Anaerovoracaceae bacterium]